ncbi:hypothetical protein CCAX7_57990 [Capsulimonas corticalis]|uniref:Uncharacterized protein n=1 Tax=Capsulimonas corticalis TaxID=2219043 RepID=A0A402D026_9BACT|nr:hypothetical protein [Capsulimonas corticalis]BDI33748.1 hypothetical protein CCAX7_57990 [Capsulimonas corticalis]
MTVQIARTPALRRGETPAALGIARYLWMRFHRMLGSIVALLVVSTLLDRANLWSRAGASADARDCSHVLLMLLMPVLLVLGPMIAVFEYDRNLWLLPLRTQTLVAWLMLYGSGCIALFWIVDAVCVWRPAGWNAPILFPAAALAGAQALVFAIHCQPITSGKLRAAAYLMCAAVLLGAGAGASALGASPAVLAAGSLALIPMAYAAAVTGAARTRRGDILVHRGKADRRVSGALRERFPSARHAQLWWESHWYRPYAATIAVICIGALSLPILAATFTEENSAVTALTHGARHIIVNIWADLAPLILEIALAITAMVLGIGLGFQGSGTPQGSTTQPQFFAAFPMDCAARVAAKLRTAAAGSIAAMIGAAPFLILWLAQPAWEHGRRITLAAALWSVLGFHALTIAVAGLLLLTMLIWKLQTETLCLTLTGRPWVFGAAYALIILPLSIPHVSNWLIETTSHVFSAPAKIPFLGGALAVAVLLKLAISASLLRQMRRRGLMSAQTLRQTLTLWSAATGALLILSCAAVPSEYAPWPQTALFVILLMPGVRLALAPFAAAWDRSR